MLRVPLSMLLYRRVCFFEGGGCSEIAFILQTLRVPCLVICSFAGHLVGKMNIHCPLAHHDSHSAGNELKKMGIDLNTANHFSREQKKQPDTFH